MGQKDDPLSDCMALASGVGVGSGDMSVESVIVSFDVFCSLGRPATSATRLGRFTGRGAVQSLVRHDGYRVPSLRMTASALLYS